MSDRFNRLDAPPKFSTERESVSIEILSLNEVADFVQNNPCFATGILFGGDRLSCCDEGVGIDLDGALVGVATIAPKGEQGSGIPTIVGVYVDKIARNKQLGRRLFLAAIQRCQERGFSRIHVDVMSAGMKKIIDSLPSETRDLIEVQDCGDLIGEF